MVAETVVGEAAVGETVMGESVVTVRPTMVGDLVGAGVGAPVVLGQYTEEQKSWLQVEAATGPQC
jgi:hypothetical protein